MITAGMCGMRRRLLTKVGAADVAKDGTAGLGVPAKAPVLPCGARQLTPWHPTVNVGKTD
jgi:hypothetical protein